MATMDQHERTDKARTTEPGRGATRHLRRHAGEPPAMRTAGCAAPKLLVGRCERAARSAGLAIHASPPRAAGRYASMWGSWSRFSRPLADPRSARPQHPPLGVRRGEIASLHAENRPPWRGFPGSEPAAEQRQVDALEVAQGVEGDVDIGDAEAELAGVDLEEAADWHRAGGSLFEAQGVGGGAAERG